jgi:hypothetical protein
MGIRSRTGGALVIGVLVALLAGGPASAEDATSPTTNPLAPILRLITPPRRPAPAPPPTAPPAPPAPTAPAGSGTGKRIVYCVSCHRVWLVEANEAVSRTHLVSGRAGVPRPGTYAVFSKSTRSTSGSVTLAYMVRFAHGRSLAIGFHAIPRDRHGRPIQTEAELGQYRSHGCVRQSDGDALALWSFAPVGTKVVVI